MFWQVHGATGWIILSAILENSMAISTIVEKSEYIFSQNAPVCVPKETYEKGFELCDL